jgi:hypothetical protein
LLLLLLLYCLIVKGVARRDTIQYAIQVPVAYAYMYRKDLPVPVPVPVGSLSTMYRTVPTVQLPQLAFAFFGSSSLVVYRYIGPTLPVGRTYPVPVEPTGSLA